VTVASSPRYALPVATEPQAVDEYLSQPYRVVVTRVDGAARGWVATVEELDGCVADGNTKRQATERIRRSMRAWIEEALESGRTIPPPRGEKGYSGRLLLRMPEALHEELAATAERRRVSLNQLIVDLLSGSLNSGSATTRDPKDSRRRLGDAALVVNIVVLVVVAVVAALLLVAALRHGL
jgi:antitoxin HicB